MYDVIKTPPLTPDPPIVDILVIGRSFSTQHRKSLEFFIPTHINLKCKTKFSLTRFHPKSSEIHPISPHFPDPHTSSSRTSHFYLQRRISALPFPSWCFYQIFKKSPSPSLLKLSVLNFTQHLHYLLQRISVYKFSTPTLSKPISQRGT